MAGRVAGTKTYRPLARSPAKIIAVPIVAAIIAVVLVAHRLVADPVVVVHVRHSAAAVPDLARARIEDVVSEAAGPAARLDRGLGDATLHLAPLQLDLKQSILAAHLLHLPLDVGLDAARPPSGAGGGGDHSEPKEKLGKRLKKKCHSRHDPVGIRPLKE